MRPESPLEFGFIWAWIDFRKCGKVLVPRLYGKLVRFVDPNRAMLVVVLGWRKPIMGKDGPRLGIDNYWCVNRVWILVIWL